MYTLIPAALNLISIVPMLFYKLSGKKMVEIQSKLAQRREQERAELDGSVDGAEIAAVSDSIAAGTLHIDGEDME